MQRLSTHPLHHTTAIFSFTATLSVSRHLLRSLPMIASNPVSPLSCLTFHGFPVLPDSFPSCTQTGKHRYSFSMKNKKYSHKWLGPFRHHGSYPSTFCSITVSISSSYLHKICIHYIIETTLRLEPLSSAVEHNVPHSSDCTSFPTLRFATNSYRCPMGSWQIFKALPLSRTYRGTLFASNPISNASDLRSESIGAFASCFSILHASSSFWKVLLSFTRQSILFSSEFSTAPFTSLSLYVPIKLLFDVFPFPFLPFLLSFHTGKNWPSRALPQYSHISLLQIQEWFKSSWMGSLHRFSIFKIWYSENCFYSKSNSNLWWANPIFTEFL